MADMKCKTIGPGCPTDGSSLGYAPNMAASIIFMSIFSLSLIGHAVLGWKYKTWTFMVAMLLGSSSEVVGYLGRIMMHNNPYRLSTYAIVTLSALKYALIELNGQFSRSNRLPHNSTSLLFSRNLPLPLPNVRAVTFSFASRNQLTSSITVS